MDTMAYMAALKSVRTVLALAAPAGHYLRNFDISQAFTFSKCARDVYMEQLRLRGWAYPIPKFMGEVGVLVLLQN